MYAFAYIRLINAILRLERDGLVPVLRSLQGPSDTDDQLVDPAAVQLGETHHVLHGREFFSRFPLADDVPGGCEVSRIKLSGQLLLCQAVQNAHFAQLPSGGNGVDPHQIRRKGSNGGSGIHNIALLNKNFGPGAPGPIDANNRYVQERMHIIAFLTSLYPTDPAKSTQ